MKNMHSIVLMALSILLAVPAVGQDPADILKKMNRNYAEANSYRMDVQVNVFQQQQLVSAYEGLILKADQQHYSEMMGQTTLMNERYALSIDHEDKVIVCGQRPKEQQASDTELESLLATIGDPNLVELSYVGLRGGNYHIIAKPKNNQGIRKIELLVDERKFTLQQIVYHYGGGSNMPFNRIEINYSSIQFDQRIAPSRFSEKRFITKQGGQLVPVPALNGYRIIDQS